MAHTKQGAVAYYIIIALILGAITYVEFAIIQYHQSFAWLSPTWKVIILTVLSLAKFALVVAIYMHLRDDDPMYTGFFSSGLIIALGTFIVLSFLFTVRSVANLRSRAEVETAAHGEHEAVTIPTERTLVESLRVPVPKDQSFQVEPPLAPTPNFSLPVLSFGVADASSMPAIVVAEETASTAATPTDISETSAEASSDTTDAAAETASTETSSGSTAAVLAQAAEFDWQALGETTYTASCSACHQANGQGIPSAFPPLAEHLPELYNTTGGRQYIISVVLYGLQGAIKVKGADYNGAMPGWAQLSDEQIAATLNHELNSWGNDALLVDFSPILPEEVAAERGKDMTSAKVLELRPALP